MNKDLAEVITTYSTKPHENLAALLLGKSKDQLIAILNDLITVYINDRNSSALREFITVSIAGYEHHTSKIGYNGFKHSTALGTKPICCEAKPQNINTEDNKKRKNSRKLNGGGNFTDYTNRRLEKDLAEKDLSLLISGFVDGELIYILEFPFSDKNFVGNLKKQLKKRFPKGDKSNEYLRSARFTFQNYKESQHIRTVYLNKNALERNRKNLTKKFFDFLEQF